jgi:outer membrane protein assembly factor BamB
MTAWSGPARWDAYAGNEGLQSMRNFDPVFFVTAAGDRVYFGSSVDHAVHCLDARTGRESWVFFTGGPVRLPPTCHRDLVYFGSDDGFAYAVNARTGALQWKTTPRPGASLIVNNGKLISPWPCRTGVLVQDRIAYFAASLLPWEPSYLCAVDAETGTSEGAGLFIAEQKEVTLQGALLASSDSIYVPQGRSAPLVYERATGKTRGTIRGAGGVYCILTEEEQLISGPQNQKSPDFVLRLADPSRGRSLMTIRGANRILVSGSMAYLHQGRMLTAFDRKRFTALSIRRDALLARKKKEPDAIKAVEKEIAACRLWAKPHPVPLGFMLTSDTLFVGGDGHVDALDTGTGTSRWQAEVAGKAYGLAAAGGRLFVSTDRGAIYCFAPLP